VLLGEFECAAVWRWRKGVWMITFAQVFRSIFCCMNIYLSRYSKVFALDYQLGHVHKQVGRTINLPNSTVW
jgi:hypothetical protein